MKTSKLKLFLEKHSQKVLLGAIFLYILFFSLVSFWKYNHYLYNALDLAIYNQTFYNTSLGYWFKLSIHPPTYLGDHFEPLIFLLSFIYSLWRDPRMLLFFQSFILGISAWPVYLIAREVFKNYQSKNFYALIAGLFFLVNPFTQNINLFEYHMLPWAIFFVLFTFYFYQKKLFLPFFIFIILSFLVREDVPLVIFMFGPIYLIDFWKKQKNLRLKIKDWLWVLTPMILSVIWFVAALKVITFFNSDSSYKFLHYYSWIGNSWGDIFINILKHPLKVFLHLITIGNMEMVLGFLFAFLFLPLIFPRYLILAAGVLCQIVLGAPGGSELIFKIHYSSLFLPALIISSLYGVEIFIKKRKERHFISINQERKKEFFLIVYFKETYRILNQEKELLVVILVVAAVFFNLTLGPLAGLARDYLKDFKEEKIIKNSLVNQISPESSVIASYGFLSNLSSRRNVFSLNYVFIGKKQMSEQPYILPKEIDWLAVDFDDFLAFQLQYQKEKEFEEDYQSGPSSIKKVLKEKDLGLVEIFDDFALFKKGEADKIDLVKTKKGEPNMGDTVYSTDEIKFFPSSQTAIINQKIAGRQIKFIKTILSWQSLRKVDKDYQLKLGFEDESSKVLYEKIYPLAYGLYPTSSWQPNEQIEATYYFLIPQEIGGKKIKAVISLVDLEGSVRLSSGRYVIKDYEKQNQIGEKILLTTLNYQ